MPPGGSHRARKAAAKHDGAIAFSRTGEVSEAVILLKLGEVDEGMIKG